MTLRTPHPEEKTEATTDWHGTRWWTRNSTSGKRRKADVARVLSVIELPKAYATNSCRAAISPCRPVQSWAGLRRPVQTCATNSACAGLCNEFVLFRPVQRIPPVQACATNFAGLCRTVQRIPPVKSCAINAHFNKRNQLSITHIADKEIITLRSGIVCTTWRPIVGTPHRCNHSGMQFLTISHQIIINALVAWESAVTPGCSGCLV